MSRKILTVRIESDEEFHDRVLEDLEALESGDELDDAYELSLPDEHALARVLSEPNLELLRVIAEHEPESIREAARVVDRGVKEVHQNLTELEQYGMVELQDQGRAKRPVIWYDDIEITFPVRSSSSEEGPAAA